MHRFIFHFWMASCCLISTCLGESNSHQEIPSPSLPQHKPLQSPSRNHPERKEPPLCVRRPFSLSSDQQRSGLLPFPHRPSSSAAPRSSNQSLARSDQKPAQTPLHSIPKATLPPRPPLSPKLLKPHRSTASLPSKPRLPIAVKPAFLPPKAISLPNENEMATASNQDHAVSSPMKQNKERPRKTIPLRPRPRAVHKKN
jgi:hypothetical protein